MTVFNRLRGELASLIVGQIINIIASVTSIKIITSEVGPSIYGSFNVLLTLQVGLMQLLFGPIASACLRFTIDARTDKSSKDLLAASIQLALLYFILIVVIATPIVILIPKAYFGDSILAIPMLTVTAVFYGIYYILCQYLNGARKRTIYAFICASLPILQCGSCLITLHFVGKNLYSIVIGYAVASILASLFAYVCVHSFCLARENRNKRQVSINSCTKIAWMNEIAKYSFHFSQWGAFSLLYVVSDKWALNFFGGSYDVGTYSLAFQLGYGPVAIIGGLIMQFISPILFRSVDKIGDELYVLPRGIKLVVLSIIGCLSFALFFAPFSVIAISIIAPQNYSLAQQYAPILAIAAGLGASSEMIGLLFQSELRIKSLVNLKILLSIFGLLLNFLMARYFGPLGVCSSLLIYGLLQLSGNTLLWAKHSALRKPC